MVVWTPAVKRLSIIAEIGFISNDMYWEGYFRCKEKGKIKVCMNKIINKQGQLQETILAENIYFLNRKQ